VFGVNSNDGSAMEDRFEIVISPQSTTGVANLAPKFSTVVIPNPGNGRNLTLVLKNGQNIPTRILITDMLGKVVSDEEYTPIGNNIALDTNLPMGVYQVSVRNGGKTSIQKIVVNR